MVGNRFVFGLSSIFFYLSLGDFECCGDFFFIVLVFFLFVLGAFSFSCFVVIFFWVNQEIGLFIV